ncbi:concanavalin A-like lectin/glucanase domain-containing protein [Xylariales sp. PMI_506]|nr:concanavalin A-like lectin/glucanase domain-containing protein [Xylariales sp. PMI_506]
MWLAGASVVDAQSHYLVDQLSFGYNGRINDRGEQAVPSFSLQGEPDLPEVLSNKVILTQPSPGNARGAVWADKPNTYQNWIADVDFRVNGPERGGGNLNFWLAKDGVQNIGTASIYKAGRFDGLALVVDRSGGGAGMLRGFLNDGSTDYSNHHSVDSLAFGHCEYSYRNLGRPSQIKIRQSSTNFKVEIDGNLCFESNNVNIPSGYQFGLTAASAENPDSFEIFKLVVMTQESVDDADLSSSSQFQTQQDSYGQAGSQNSQGGSASGDGQWENSVPDVDADSISGSQAQFKDLHVRLQSIDHHMRTLFQMLSSQSSVGEARQQETSQQIHEIKTLVTTLNSRLDKLDNLDKLDALQNQVLSLEREIKNTHNNIASKIRESENNIRKLLGDTHGSMLEHVAVQTAPKHGKLIFVIFGGQIFLVAAFVFYERKKAWPKKYL